MVNRIVKKEKAMRRRDFERRKHIVFSKSDIRITKISSFVKQRKTPTKDNERMNPFLRAGKMARLGDHSMVESCIGLG